MSNRFRFLVGVTTLTLLVIAALSPAHALRVKRLSLEQLRQHAHSVVLGTVVESSVRPGDKSMLWTDYTIAVEETLAGSPRSTDDRGTNDRSTNDRITVSFAGGELQGQRVGILHAPTLIVGERYVLFLLPDRPYAVPTVGWGQGIYRIVDAELDSQDQDQRQVLISADGEPLEIDSGKLTRGPKLQMEQTASGHMRLRLPPAQTLGRSDYFQKADSPTVFDADGNQRSLSPTAASPQRRIIRPAQREFATLDNLRTFIQAEPPQ